MLFAACKHDPYDPILGGRNPLPGAVRHLKTYPALPPESLQAILHQSPCPLDDLRMVVGSSSREVRSLVAANPAADAELLELLSQDKEVGVRQYVGTNPVTPRPILLRLRADPDANVRFCVPGNTAWTAQDLREMHLQGTAQPSVLAGNPSSPGDVLDALSTSDSYFVQSMLVRNPSLTVTAATRLAQVSDPSIRSWLARHPITPREVLEQLAQDPDPEVREPAAQRLRSRPDQ
jgi:Leucine rich repeat variant